MRIWNKQISIIMTKIGMIHLNILQNVFVYSNIFLTKIWNGNKWVILYYS